jgi:hypothetical protein
MAASINLHDSWQLQKFLAPRLEAIAADANIEGSVRQHLDPLLQALPSSVVLTGGGCASLGLEKLELAYVLYDSWRRASPEPMLIGEYRARAQGFARVFEEARAYAKDQQEPFEPDWFRASGDFVVVSPELKLGDVYLGQDRLPFCEARELTLERVSQSQNLVYAAVQTGAAVLELFFNKTAPASAPKGRAHATPWELTVHQRPGLRPYTLRLNISQIPTAFLERFRDVLSSTPSQERESGEPLPPTGQGMLGDLIKAMDRVLLARRKKVEASAHQALAAFHRGEIDALVAELPPATLSALAPLAARAKARRR